MNLADRLARIKEPQTIQMSKMARAVQAEGHDVISLSLGEPDFATPSHIIEAATQAMHDGYTKYTPVAGMPELREAIAKKLKRDNNLDYKPSQIMVSTGAKQSLANAILSLINPGDEVLVPTPYWVTYRGLVELAEGTVVEVRTAKENEYKLTAAELEAAITAKTKAFVFSSPCNPSGSVYTHEELEALVKVFEKYPNIYIISDEIYEYINFQGKHFSIASFESIKDRVIIINGLSKGFSMTGWRLGYLAGPENLVNACDKLQGQFTSGANSITQRAAIVALTASLEPTYAMRDEFKKRRDYVVNFLEQIPGIEIDMPEGAFYAFPDVSKYFDGEEIKNSEDFCLMLLNEAHVSTVMGSAFGEPNCIRISYASSMEKLEEAMQRIKKILDAKRRF